MGALDAPLRAGTGHLNSRTQSGPVVPEDNVLKAQYP
jgi:hypothetical protein